MSLPPNTRVPPPPPPAPDAPDAPRSDSDPYKVVDQMPRFPGCEDEEDELEKVRCAQAKMMMYLYNDIRYPQKAREQGIQGTVVVGFVVERDGSINEISIKRNIGGGCGKEALRVVRSMNDMEEKWIPGYQDGKAVRVQYNLPIKFKLEKGNTKVRSKQ